MKSVKVPQVMSLELVSVWAEDFKFVRNLLYCG